MVVFRYFKRQFEFFLCVFHFFESHSTYTDGRINVAFQIQNEKKLFYFNRLENHGNIYEKRWNHLKKKYLFWLDQKWEKSFGKVFFDTCQCFISISNTKCMPTNLIINFCCHQFQGILRPQFFEFFSLVLYVVW